MTKMYDTMKIVENRWDQYKKERDEIQVEYTKAQELNNQLSDIIRFRSKN